MTPINNTPSSIYQQRISALHDTKMEHTALKVELYGHFDTDDHGYIPWTEPIPFEVIPNHPSGDASARCASAPTSAAGSRFTRSISTP